MTRDGSPIRTRMESPQFERIAPSEGDTFVWRVDDYPWRRSVWNCHPEVEIHLIRHSSGTALIGDFVGDFGPGELVLVGSWLPHDWISHCKPGEKIAGRDLIIQFDPKVISGAVSFFPELSAINDLLERALCGLRFAPSVAQNFAVTMEKLGNLVGPQRLARLFRPSRRHGRDTGLSRAVTHTDADDEEEGRGEHAKHYLLHPGKSIPRRFFGGNRPSCRDDADVAQPVFQETRRPELCGVHHAP